MNKFTSTWISSEKILEEYVEIYGLSSDIPLTKGLKEYQSVLSLIK